MGSAAGDPPTQPPASAPDPNYPEPKRAKLGSTTPAPGGAPPEVVYTKMTVNEWNHTALGVSEQWNYSDWTQNVNASATLMSTIYNGLVDAYYTWMVQNKENKQLIGGVYVRKSFLDKLLPTVNAFFSSTNFNQWLTDNWPNYKYYYKFVTFLWRVNWTAAGTTALSIVNTILQWNGGAPRRELASRESRMLYLDDTTKSLASGYTTSPGSSYNVSTVTVVHSTDFEEFWLIGPTDHVFIGADYSDLWTIDLSHDWELKVDFEPDESVSFTSLFGFLIGGNAEKYYQMTTNGAIMCPRLWQTTSYTNGYDTGNYVSQQNTHVGVVGSDEFMLGNGTLFTGRQTLSMICKIKNGYAHFYHKTTRHADGADVLLASEAIVISGAPDATKNIVRTMLYKKIKYCYSVILI